MSPLRQVLLARIRELLREADPEHSGWLSPDITRRSDKELLDLMAELHWAKKLRETGYPI